MNDIVNVPQLCAKLMQERQDREQQLTSGILPTVTEDLLVSLDDDDFLQGNLQAVDDWLAQPAGTEYDQISVLEANALLAAAQNAYGLVMRDSFARRLGRQKLLQLLYRERGVLDDQLKLVGTVVDAPLLLQLSGQEIPDVNS